MKYRLPLLALALLLLNVAFYFLVVFPTRSTAQVHAATAQELQARMRSLRHEERQQQLLESLLKRMDQFRTRIPPHGAILQMVRRVTDQARKLRLSVPSVTYQPEEVTEEDLVKLTVQMQVEGEYPAIRRFLYEIEGLQDPLVIEKLVLASQGKTDRLSLRLDMAAYFLEEADSRVNPESREGRV